ncbi:hypothetical protein HY249_00785, partial [Candidatus Azambacteria bacterium]|nr:hypothetical protein [Candidatus Azambacteria bacterium]
MNLTAKNKFYIYLASLFAVLCGMIFAGWFVAGIVKKDGEKLTQLKSDLFQIQKKREKALEASEEYNSFKSSIDLANATILPRQDELKFIVFIEDIANNNRLNHETNITTP